MPLDMRGRHDRRKQDRHGGAWATHGRAPTEARSEHQQWHAAKHTLGWIGMGRMGYPMAERLLKAGNTVSIWNRTRAKAEPLAKLGGRHRRDAGRSRRLRPRVRHGVDRQGPGAGLLRQGRRRCGRQGQGAEGDRRLLVDLGRGIGGLPGQAAGAGRRFPRRAGQRQRQGGEGRQAERRRVGAQGRIRDRPSPTC